MDYPYNKKIMKRCSFKGHKFCERCNKILKSRQFDN
jgi:hypothetical protein